MTSVAASATQWFIQFLSSAPESGVLILWGGLLLFAAQRVRRVVGVQRPADRAAEALETHPSGNPGVRESQPAWSPGVAVARRVSSPTS
jgi:hypothetical protein